jgi:hypothetical protein
MKNDLRSRESLTRLASGAAPLFLTGAVLVHTYIVNADRGPYACCCDIAGGLVWMFVVLPLGVLGIQSLFIAVIGHIWWWLRPHGIAPVGIEEYDSLKEQP